MAISNEGEPLAYIDSDNEGVDFAQVEKLAHVMRTVDGEGRIGDEFRANIQRRLKSSSTAVVLNTVTLLHTISLNLDEPALRARLADSGLLSRCQKLVQGKDARCSGAVMQLLVDWDHMFRDEVLGQKANELLSKRSMRSLARPAVTHTAQQHYRAQGNPGTWHFVRGVDFGAPEGGAATFGLEPRARSLMAEGRSSEGEPSVSRHSMSSVVMGALLQPVSSRSRDSSASGTPNSKSRMSPRSIFGGARTIHSTSTHVHVAPALASSAVVTERSVTADARQLVANLERHTRRLQDTHAALLSDIKQRNAARIQERQEVGDHDQSILDRLRQEVRLLVVQPLEGDALECLLLKNDQANSAIAMWKSARDAALVEVLDQMQIQGSAAALLHSRQYNSISDALTPTPGMAASSAAPYRGSAPQTPTESTSTTRELPRATPGSSMHSSHSEIQPAGDEHAAVRNLEYVSATPTWPGDAASCQRDASPSGCLLSNDALLHPAPRISSLSAPMDSPSGGVASDLRFAQARIRSLESDNLRLKGRVAELESKVARDQVTHRHAQQQISELVASMATGLAVAGEGSDTSAEGSRSCQGADACSTRFSKLLNQPSLQLADREYLKALLAAMASSQPTPAPQALH